MRSFETSSIKRPDYRVHRKSCLKDSKRPDRFCHPVLYSGRDVTPKPLNPLSFKEGKERQMSVLNVVGRGNVTQSSYSGSTFRIYSHTSFSKLQTELHLQSVLALGGFQQSFIASTSIDYMTLEPERGKSTISDIIGYEEEEVVEKPLEMPSKIKVTLVETPTIFIFDIPSYTVYRDSEEGTLCERDNALYDNLTIGKGRNRKVVDAEVQTTLVLRKTRDTEAARVKCKNNYAYASDWDMFDTYGTTNEDESPVDKTKKEIKSTSGTTIESFVMTAEEKQMARLVKTDNFVNALLVIERLLANNNYNEQQKRFRGIVVPDPFREDVEFTYRLDLLWTFANDRTQGRCVTAVCWNYHNDDVLAAGYGKFYYSEVTTGMVMIWNIKNPVQPERVYDFPIPVTSIDFSKQHPNLLAVGFYNGDIKVLDISDLKINYIGVTNRVDSPLFEPIWQVLWYTDEDYYKGMEFLMAVSQDGRISKFSLENNMRYFHMMLICKAEGELKGLKVPTRCDPPGVPIVRHPSAVVFTQHPVDPTIYYVGTSEGVVHKCSKNYYHQHVDLFLAHEGPIYQIKFSPFCNKLFLTCGDDWMTRIWAEGISEPLMELSKTMQSVQCADWSSKYSTIIATITSSDIFIWDLQRKAYAPQSVTKSPTKARNTIVQFTRNGLCLLVADVEGYIHIFSLEDMPFPAFFQDDLLLQSIRRELIINPDMLRKFDKLGKLNYEKSYFGKHFQ